MRPDVDRGITGISMMVFVCLIAFLLIRIAAGCAPREYAPLPPYCYEEPLYTAALVRCVDKSETLEESKSCRANVDKVCGITETVKR